jgi:hypothetical protein
MEVDEDIAEALQSVSRALVDLADEIAELGIKIEAAAPVAPQHERRLRAQVAAHTSWANTDDRAARTASARSAAMARFEAQVDPDGVLSAAERSRRADHARKAYFTQLALKSAQARRNPGDEDVA